MEEMGISPSGEGEEMEEKKACMKNWEAVKDAKIQFMHRITLCNEEKEGKGCAREVSRMQVLPTKCPKKYWCV